MLAFMPQSPPLSDLHTPTSMASSMTMSLAILPSSPMTYTQTTCPSLLPTSPAPSKRPKLSLNTNQVPSPFGKGSTSLRLETLSAMSPTIRNTFSNAYDAPSLKTPGMKGRRPALQLGTNVSPVASRVLTPLAPVASRVLTPIAPVASRVLTPLTTDLAETPELTSTSSVASASSICTTDSLHGEVPYKLGNSLVSILNNGPIPRIPRRRLSFGRTRPMFPLAKHVAFKAPLTEEVKNVKYTIAHSDLESSASTISTLELAQSETSVQQNAEQQLPDKRKDAQEGTALVSPRTGGKRESSDEEDSDTCPATPVAGRRKKHRQWVWTLGSLDNAPPAGEERPGDAGCGEEKSEGT